MCPLPMLEKAKAVCRIRYPFGSVGQQASVSGSVSGRRRAAVIRQQLHQIGAEGASIRRIPPCPKPARTRAGEPWFKLLAATSKEVVIGAMLALLYALLPE